MVETTHIPTAGTVDPADVERFSRIADEWWDPNGKFAPLHRLNPVRIGYVRDRVAAHWGRDALNGEPLQGLCLSSAALAQMAQAPVAQWREFAGNLQREGERLRGVVDDLVVVEAIRRGEGRRHWVRHDAANLTADALRLAAATFAAKQQRSELRVDGPTAIDCDAPRFVDVLVRCLGDACARGQRGGLVQVLVQGLPDRVEVTIADDLPGLRVPQQTPPTGATNDLGLTVGRELLAAMGGSLHREDSPCGGQQLRLVVPAAASARV